jgi:hypothetical protein
VKARCLCGGIEIEITGKLGPLVYSRRRDAPEVLRIRLGLLDDDPGRRALCHFWAGSKAPWYEIADGLPQFAGGPEDHAEEVAARLGPR